MQAPPLPGGGPVSRAAGVRWGHSQRLQQRGNLHARGNEAVTAESRIVYYFLCILDPVQNSQRLIFSNLSIFSHALKYCEISHSAVKRAEA